MGDFFMDKYDFKDYIILHIMRLTGYTIDTNKLYKKTLKENIKIYEELIHSIYDRLTL